LSVVLWKWDHLGILDPIYTLVVSVLIILSTFGLTKEVFRILVEAVPEEVDIKKLLFELRHIDGVRKIVDFHCWEMAEGKVAMICHLVCDQNIDY
jgi:cobalt-zinc-cadmium efflux system protein